MDLVSSIRVNIALQARESKLEQRKSSVSLNLWASLISDGKAWRPRDRSHDASAKVEYYDTKGSRWWQGFQDDGKGTKMSA